MIHFPANSYTVIRPDGSQKQVKQNQQVDREQAEALLGGPVEFVPLPDRALQMIVLAEGRLSGFPENKTVVKYFARPVYGPALFLTGYTRWK